MRNSVTQMYIRRVNQQLAFWRKKALGMQPRALPFLDRKLALPRGWCEKAMVHLLHLTLASAQRGLEAESLSGTKQNHTECLHHLDLYLRHLFWNNTSSHGSDELTGSLVVVMPFPVWQDRVVQVEASWAHVAVEKPRPGCTPCWFFFGIISLYSSDVCCTPPSCF